MMIIRKARLAVPLLAAVAALTAAGCGSDDKPSSKSSGAPKATATAAVPADVPSIEEQTTKGTEAAPPTEGPAPGEGKNVWFVSCGQQVPDCSEPAGAAGEAAKSIGWEFHIADAKLNVGGGQLTALRTAIADKPDAIIIHGSPCSIQKPGLQNAKEKNIPVVAIEAPDCADEKLLTVDMKYTESAPDNNAYFEEWGRRGAQYIIAKSGGKATIINNVGAGEVFEFIQKGFDEEIKKCSGCEIIDTVKFVQADQIPNGPWIQRFRAALVKNPTATYAHLPSSALTASLGGVAAAKKANPKMQVVGGGSTAPAMDLIRGGSTLAATSGHSLEWLGYGAIDQLNRKFNNEESVPQGVGFRAVDKDHIGDANQKPGTSYKSDVDWKSAYMKLWGIE